MAHIINYICVIRENKNNKTVITAYKTQIVAHSLYTTRMIPLHFTTAPIKNVQT